MTPQQLREWAVEQERHFGKGTQSASIARAHAHALEELERANQSEIERSILVAEMTAALKSRAERAEAELAYVRKTLDEARPGMDKGAPIEAIVRKVVSALAESERRTERLKFHADAMAELLWYGPSDFAAEKKALDAYRAFKEKTK